MQLAWRTLQRQPAAARPPWAAGRQAEKLDQAEAQALAVQADKGCTAG